MELLKNVKTYTDTCSGLIVQKKIRRERRTCYLYALDKTFITVPFELSLHVWVYAHVYMCVQTKVDLSFVIGKSKICLELQCVCQMLRVKKT